MKEQHTVIERLRHIAGAGLLGLALAGCVVDELPAGSPKDAAAVTSRIGVFFKRGNENNPRVWQHEFCHVQQAQEYGWNEWFDRYNDDIEFARSQEVECGADLTNSAYDRLK